MCNCNNGCHNRCNHICGCGLLNLFCGCGCGCNRNSNWNNNCDCGSNRNRDNNCNCCNWRRNDNCGCGHCCRNQVRNAWNSFSVLNNVSNSCDAQTGCGCYDAYYAAQYGLYNNSCCCRVNSCHSDACNF